MRAPGAGGHAFYKNAFSYNNLVVVDIEKKSPRKIWFRTCHEPAILCYAALRNRPSGVLCIHASFNELQPNVVIPGHGKVTDVQGVMRLQNLLQSFWDAVVKGYDEGQSDFEMVDDVTIALAKFVPHYPGLEEKVKRDISGVFLQVEAASFQ